MRTVTPAYELTLLDLGQIEHYMLSDAARALLKQRMDEEDALIEAEIERCMLEARLAYAE